MSPHTPTAAPTRVSLGLFFLLHLIFAGAAGWMLWVLAPAVKHSYEASFGLRPAPSITEVFFDYGRHALLLPLPWLAIALFAMVRGRMAQHNLLLYSCSLVLSVVLLALTAATAVTFPWLPVRQDVQQSVFGSAQNLITF